MSYNEKKLIDKTKLVVELAEKAKKLRRLQLDIIECEEMLKKSTPSV